MVRISANTSKPSNVHPRFEAISAFHCVRVSERYHGECPKMADSLMVPSLRCVWDLAVAKEAYANICAAWNTVPTKRAMKLFLANFGRYTLAPSQVGARARNASATTTRVNAG